MCVAGPTVVAHSVESITMVLDKTVFGQSALRSTLLGGTMEFRSAVSLVYLIVTISRSGHLPYRRYRGVQGYCSARYHTPRDSVSQPASYGLRAVRRFVPTPAFVPLSFAAVSLVHRQSYLHALYPAQARRIYLHGKSCAAVRVPEPCCRFGGLPGANDH